MRISEKWKDRAEDAQAFLELYQHAVHLEHVIDAQKAMGDELIEKLNQLQVELAEAAAEKDEDGEKPKKK